MLVTTERAAANTSRLPGSGTTVAVFLMESEPSYVRVGDGRWLANARLIAYAREAIPLLLDEVEGLRAEARGLGWRPREASPSPIRGGRCMTEEEFLQPDPAPGTWGRVGEFFFNISPALVSALFRCGVWEAANAELATGRVPSLFGEHEEASLSQEQGEVLASMLHEFAGSGESRRRLRLLRGSQRHRFTGRGAVPREVRAEADAEE